MRKYNFKFGERVKCQMSGVEGNIDAVVEWNNGSYQYSVHTDVKPDGSNGDSEWMDWQDFESIEGGCVQRDVSPVFEFGLGDKISIRYNPFIGYVIGMSWWANGCARYMLRSKDLNDGATVSQWFSSVEMNKINAPEIGTKSKKPTGTTGGPSSNSRSAKA